MTSVSIVSRFGRAKYGTVPVWIDPVQGHFDNLANAVFVDMVHGVCRNIMVPKKLFLSRIYIAQSNIRNSVGSKALGDLSMSLNEGDITQDRESGRSRAKPMRNDTGIP